MVSGVPYDVPQRADRTRLRLPSPNPAGTRPAQRPAHIVPVPRHHPRAAVSRQFRSQRRPTQPQGSRVRGRITGGLAIVARRANSHRPRRRSRPTGKSPGTTKATSRARRSTHRGADGPTIAQLLQLVAAAMRFTPPPPPGRHRPYSANRSAARVRGRRDRRAVGITPGWRPGRRRAGRPRSRRRVPPGRRGKSSTPGPAPRATSAAQRPDSSPYARVGAETAGHRPKSGRRITVLIVRSTKSSRQASASCSASRRQSTTSSRSATRWSFHSDAVPRSAPGRRRQRKSNDSPHAMSSDDGSRCPACAAPRRRGAGNDVPATVRDQSVVARLAAAVAGPSRAAWHRRERPIAPAGDGDDRVEPLR